ncbi:MAG: hypothetical protein A3I61_19950 [Acidobacteria bacterium RIFCSPLOWO2_02_FULL_68_18]|nr:MAG: hypothetical protein A3I61_19950 [Acidobacteria bacterium RIFCSPLOWO2_02_FULL_68_18]OFW48263.1 MAG: hypothetical protein A3G77_03190 [Acidobacteria bacterium RIFCSPLOWO2_12_FULL_68_19]
MALDAAAPGLPDQVRGIVAAIMGVGPAEVAEDASPETLAAWDSLRHMKLILAVEEAFGLRLTDSEIVSITDLQSLVTLVRRKRGGGA